MKWMLIVGVTLVAVVALAALIGSRLPRSHRASREQILPAPPAVVWTAITDIDRFPSWRSDVKTVTRLPDRNGGAAWIEDGRSGRVTFVVERMAPPRLLVTRIADPDLPFGGAWTYEMEPAGNGSRLKITEDGEIYNPIFRFMARFVFGYESTMDAYLSALAKRVAEPRVN